MSLGIPTRPASEVFSHDSLICTAARKRSPSPCGCIFEGARATAAEKNPAAAPHAEPLLMLLDRGDQQGRVRRSLVIHLVGDDDPVFRLLRDIRASVCRIWPWTSFGDAPESSAIVANNDISAQNRPPRRFGRRLLHAETRETEWWA
jgi:hypothetical protein